MSYRIIEGDLEPDMDIELFVNGSAEAFSGIDAVEMIWEKPDGTVTTVDLDTVDATQGLFRRTWVVGDTDVVGVHEAQVVVTYTSGESQTFPSNGSKLRWYVHARLA